MMEAPRAAGFRGLVPAVVMAALLSVSSAAAAPYQQSIPVEDGNTLWVTIVGEGRPVVLIPGLWGSAYGFRRIIPMLAAAGNQVIVVEPLGIGGSSKPAAADYSLGAQAERIATVLDVLGVSQATVVGHGASASIALRLAYRHPRHVASVVSIEGALTESAGTPGFRRAMRFAPLMRFFGGARMMRSQIRKRMVHGSANPSWVDDAAVDGYIAPLIRDVDGQVRAYQQMSRAEEKEALLPRLAEVRCPVRLLIGTGPHGDALHPDQVEILKRGLSAFSTEEIPGVGHFMFEEDPRAVVAAISRLQADVARLAVPDGGSRADAQ